MATERKESVTGKTSQWLSLALLSADVMFTSSLGIFSTGFSLSQNQTVCLLFPLLIQSLLLWDLARDKHE